MTEPTAKAGADAPRATPARPRKAGLAPRLGRFALRAFTRARELFPITGAGAFAVAAAALALGHYGLERFDLVLLVIGAATGGAVALAFLTVVLTAIGMRLAWRRRSRKTTAEGASQQARVRAECGALTETAHTWPLLRFLPFVKLRVRFLAPEGQGELKRHRGRYQERARFVRRSEVDRIERALDVMDAFGFCRITLRLPELRGALVLPYVGALRRVDVAQSFAKGDVQTHPLGPPEGDRADLRGYAPGDPTRLILWKVFARTGSLVVRTPERALSPARKTLAYLVTGRDDEATAAAARLAIETGALGIDWSFSADGSDEIATTPQAALDLVARSSRTEPGDEAAGLQGFLKRSSAEAGARILVFVPPTPGAWIGRAVTALRPFGSARTTAVVGLDGVPPAVKRGRLRAVLRRLFQGERAKGARRAEDLAEVTGTFARQRMRVLVLDRAAGRALAGDAFRAYLPSKGGRAAKAAPRAGGAPDREAGLDSGLDSGRGADREVPRGSRGASEAVHGGA